MDKGKEHAATSNVRRDVDVDVVVTPNRPGEPDKLRVISTEYEALPTGGLRQRQVTTATIPLPHHPQGGHFVSNGNSHTDYFVDNNENAQLNDSAFVAQQQQEFDKYRDNIGVDEGEPDWQPNPSPMYYWNLLLKRYLQLVMWAALALFLIWAACPPSMTRDQRGNLVYLPPGSKLGSRYIPWFGETLDWWNNPLNFTIEHVKKYGSVSYTDAMWNNMVVLSGPAALQQFFNPLQVAREGAYPRSVYALLAGNPSFTLDGPRHTELRHMMSRVLRTPSYLDAYIEAVDSITGRFVQRWNTQKEFNWMTEFKQLSANVATAIFLADHTKGQQFVNDFDNVLLALNAAPVAFSVNAYADGLASRQKIQAWCEDEIDFHEQQQSRIWDALHVMLTHAAQSTSPENITREDLVAELYYNILSTYAVYKPLTYMVMALTQYPEAWSRAREEVLTLSSSGPIDTRVLSLMPYLSYFINEVRRFYPMTPVVMGRVINGFFVNNYYVPAGWTAMAALYTTNHDPQQYSEPHRFNPNRFANGAEPRAGDRFGFVPQGGDTLGGHHTHRCVGEDIVLQIMQTVLVHLMRDVHWEPDFRRRSFGSSSGVVNSGGGGVHSGGVVHSGVYAPADYFELDTSQFLPEPKHGFRVRDFDARRVVA